MTEPTTKSEAVRNLQRYLRRLSMEDNGILPVPVDGIYASQTAEAVSEFQRLYSLPVTGVADRRTWDLLFGEYERLQKQIDRRETLDLFWRVPARYVTTENEESSFILFLQWLIREISLDYDIREVPPLTGIMDGATSAWVSEFQRIHGLPQTGQVDRNTWNNLVRAFGDVSD